MGDEQKTQLVTAPTYTVTVYVAGNVQDAERSLRRQCMEEGLCVTCTPTTFIYTGGAETGVAVGFVNYPRFPRENWAIYRRAVQVAEQLMNDLYQTTALVVAADNTQWLTRRKEQ
jgi:hypothetical protein